MVSKRKSADENQKMVFFERVLPRNQVIQVNLLRLSADQPARSRRLALAVEPESGDDQNFNVRSFHSYVHPASFRCDNPR